MPLSDRENYLHTVSLTGGEWIPISVGISGASWAQWKGEMAKVLLRHPTIFPRFEDGNIDYEHMEHGPANREGEAYTDAWGCVWENAWGGLEGQVKVSPLADDAAIASYRPPDALTQDDRRPVDWERRRRDAEQARQEGRLVSGDVAHGFLLMRLWYLRGFEQLMLDFATESPLLPQLLELVAGYNREYVSQWLDIGVDVMSFGEDLGTQTSSILSPATFRKYIAPIYTSLMQPCRAAGAHVELHSDGYIMDLMDIFLECGVSIINPQDLCNGIDNLAREVKGRTCIALDIDRQRILPFGTRSEIRELIKEEVLKLGSPQGGLTFVCGIYPPTPPENLDALCSALEEFRTYWAHR